MTDFPDGDKPLFLAAEERTGRFYAVLNRGELAVVDGPSGAITARLVVGHDPYGIALDDARRRAYITSFGDDTLIVVDTQALAVVGTLAVGDGPLQVAVDPLTHRVFVLMDEATLWALDGLQLP